MNRIDTWDRAKKAVNREIVVVEAVDSLTRQQRLIGK